MGARTTTDTGWAHLQHQDCFNNLQDVDNVLQKLADTFSQMNIATDFLLMRSDSEATNPELQLACMIKEGIATIQEQVTELYLVMNQEDSSPSLLHQ